LISGVDIPQPTSTLEIGENARFVMDWKIINYGLEELKFKKDVL